MRWISNTENMICKANKRLWILRRLKNLGACHEDLVEVYTKQIRCLLELAVPVWQGSITKAEKRDLERDQKCASHIILLSWCPTNSKLNWEILVQTCHNKFNTRSQKSKYCDVKTNYTRFARSPLSFITKILNLHHKWDYVVIWHYVYSC